MSPKIRKLECPLYNMGMLMIKMGKFSEGVAYFKKAIEIDPTEPYAYNNLGFTLIKSNAPREALEFINQSLKLYPENSFAYKNRALAFIAMDKNKEACADLKKAIALGYSITYDNEVDQLILVHCKE